MKQEEPKTIPVFAANLACRTDRRKSLEHQFEGRTEFELHIVEAIEDSDGAWGLWQTFCSIVEQEKEKGTPYFIFCEDDHVFTSCYEWPVLKECIAEAQHRGADLLSGGMSATEAVVQRTEHLFQVKGFTGMQFTVVFERAYDTILSDRTRKCILDRHLAEVCPRVFVTYPFISIQQEFGYSDVTANNNQTGRVSKLFEYAQASLKVLTKVRRHFDHVNWDSIEDTLLQMPGNLCLPTYVINLPQRADRRQHVLQQFAGREEFKVHLVEACQHRIGAMGLWQSICKIVAQAEADAQDVILICEDDHQFTADYDRHRFLRQVMQGGMMGADILLGGVGGFGKMMPTRHGLFWTDWFWCTQFTVIYRRAFRSILQADFKETNVADEFLSELFSNKMVIAPFISRQAEFGYSDVTLKNNRHGQISTFFGKAEAQVRAYLDILDNDSDGLISASEDEALMKTYLQTASPKGLNIGCGPNLQPGWLNTDLHPEKGAMFLNAALPFPFADNTFDYVYSEHLLEHLPYAAGKNMLRECWRVLKPGGTLRMSVPTIDFLMDLYKEPNSERTQRYVAWSLQHYAPDMYEDFQTEHGTLPVSLVINNFMHFWDHQMIYDEQTLTQVLHLAGFTKIEKFENGQSRNDFLTNLERHGEVIPQWANEMETIVVEAYKHL